MLYDDLEEIISYRRNVTGVSHALFISPKGNARHAPQIKVAITPPDSVDPRLLAQVRAFIAINRDVLEAYWNYKIDTDQLRKRLKRVP